MLFHTVKMALLFGACSILAMAFIQAQPLNGERDRKTAADKLLRKALIEGIASELMEEDAQGQKIARKPVRNGYSYDEIPAVRYGNVLISNNGKRFKVKGVSHGALGKEEERGYNSRRYESMKLRNPLRFSEDRAQNKGNHQSQWRPEASHVSRSINIRNPAAHGTGDILHKDPLLLSDENFRKLGLGSATGSGFEGVQDLLTNIGLKKTGNKANFHGRRFGRYQGNIRQVQKPKLSDESIWIKGLDLENPNLADVLEKVNSKGNDGSLRRASQKLLARKSSPVNKLLRDDIDGIPMENLHSNKMTIDARKSGSINSARVQKAATESLDIESLSDADILEIIKEIRNKEVKAVLPKRQNLVLPLDQTRAHLVLPLDVPRSDNHYFDEGGAREVENYMVRSNREIPKDYSKASNIFSAEEIADAALRIAMGDSDQVHNQYLVMGEELRNKGKPESSQSNDKLEGSRIEENEDEAQLRKSTEKTADNDKSESTKAENLDDKIAKTGEQKEKESKSMVGKPLSASSTDNPKDQTQKSSMENADIIDELETRVSELEGQDASKTGTKRKALFRM